MEFKKLEEGSDSQRAESSKSEPDEAMLGSLAGARTFGYGQDFGFYPKNNAKLFFFFDK